MESTVVDEDSIEKKAVQEILSEVKHNTDQTKSPKASQPVGNTCVNKLLYSKNLVSTLREPLTSKFGRKRKIAGLDTDLSGEETEEKRKKWQGKDTVTSKDYDPATEYIYDARMYFDPEKERETMEYRNKRRGMMEQRQQQQQQHQQQFLNGFPPPQPPLWDNLRTLRGRFIARRPFPVRGIFSGGRFLKSGRFLQRSCFIPRGYNLIPYRPRVPVYEGPYEPWPAPPVQDFYYRPEPDFGVANVLDSDYNFLSDDNSSEMVRKSKRSSQKSESLICDDRSKQENNDDRIEEKASNKRKRSGKRRKKGKKKHRKHSSHYNLVENDATQNIRDSHNYKSSSVVIDEWNDRDNLVHRDSADKTNDIVTTRQHDCSAETMMVTPNGCDLSKCVGRQCLKKVKSRHCQRLSAENECDRSHMRDEGDEVGKFRRNAWKFTNSKRKRKQVSTSVGMSSELKKKRRQIDSDNEEKILIEEGKRLQEAIKLTTKLLYGLGNTEKFSEIRHYVKSYLQNTDTNDRFKVFLSRKIKRRCSEVFLFTNNGIETADSDHQLTCKDDLNLQKLKIFEQRDSEEFIKKYRINKIIKQVGDYLSSSEHEQIDSSFDDGQASHSTEDCDLLDNLNKERSRSYDSHDNLIAESPKYQIASLEMKGTRSPHDPDSSWSQMRQLDSPIKFSRSRSKSGDKCQKSSYHKLSPKRTIYSGERSSSHVSMKDGHECYDKNSKHNYENLQIMIRNTPDHLPGRRSRDTISRDCAYDKDYHDKDYHDKDYHDKDYHDKNYHDYKRYSSKDDVQFNNDLSHGKHDRSRPSHASYEKRPCSRSPEFSRSCFNSDRYQENKFMRDCSSSSNRKGKVYENAYTSYSSHKRELGKYKSVNKPHSNLSYAEDRISTCAPSNISHERNLKDRNEEHCYRHSLTKSTVHNDWTSRCFDSVQLDDQKWKSIEPSTSGGRVSQTGNRRPSYSDRHCRANEYPLNHDDNYNSKLNSYEKVNAMGRFSRSGGPTTEKWDQKEEQYIRGSRDEKYIRTRRSPHHSRNSSLTENAEKNRLRNDFSKSNDRSSSYDSSCKAPWKSLHSTVSVVNRIKKRRSRDRDVESKSSTKVTSEKHSPGQKDLFKNSSDNKKPERNNTRK